MKTTEELLQSAKDEGIDVAKLWLENDLTWTLVKDVNGGTWSYSYNRHWTEVYAAYYLAQPVLNRIRNEAPAYSTPRDVEDDASRLTGAALYGCVTASVTEPHKCTCPTFELVSFGCRCGGV